MNTIKMTLAALFVAALPNMSWSFDCKGSINYTPSQQGLPIQQVGCTNDGHHNPFYPPVQVPAPTPAPPRNYDDSLRDIYEELKQNQQDETKVLAEAKDLESRLRKMGFDVSNDVGILAATLLRRNSEGQSASLSIITVLAWISTARN